MKKSVAIIIGGSGQFGVTVAKNLLLKKFKVIITTRNVQKNSFLLKKDKNLSLKYLDIYNKNKIYKLIKNSRPSLIFYFAGQSSPQKSFNEKNETYKSNFIGCKNVIEVIWENKINCKFLNASSIRSISSLAFARANRRFTFWLLFNSKLSILSFISRKCLFSLSYLID